jgi:hypothetical protein
VATRPWQRPQTDRTDAASVAAVALARRRVRQVAAEATRWRCGCSATAATHLVAEPTGALSRLHVLLCDLHRAAPSRT